MIDYDLMYPLDATVEDGKGGFLVHVNGPGSVHRLVHSDGYWAFYARAWG